MIEIPTNPAAHYAFDALAWVMATAAAVWQYRRSPGGALRLAAVTTPSYFVSLGLGALAGAWVFGSANSLRASLFVPSHSIAGALTGGIIAVELWKRAHEIHSSTGGAFVLPICIGIIVGRFGCFFAGIPDFTYGIPTSVPWAVDLGDGIGRHPVQLYESLSVTAFLAIYIHARWHRARWAKDHAFHAMIIFYATQRFFWEFLKPYPGVVGPLNVFHLLMIGLAAYGVIWWRRSSSGELCLV